MLSEPFRITNGTRQGCPLSPLIFALIIESLAEAILSHSLISGLKIGNTTHKIGHYTDDAIVAISNPIKSLPALQSLLECFGEISFYKVNRSKSSMIGICLDLNTKHAISALSPFPLAPASTLTYLGIQLVSSSSTTKLGEAHQKSARHNLPTTLSRSFMSRKNCSCKNVPLAAHSLPSAQSQSSFSQTNYTSSNTLVHMGA